MTAVPAKLDTEDLHEPVLPHVRRHVVRLQPEQTAEEALAAVRAQPADQIAYFYVVNEDDRLVGVVPARRLLMSRGDERVSSLMMGGVIAIPSWASVLVAAEFFVRYKLLAFPVVEDDGRLVGVVDVEVFDDEVVSLAKRSLEDIFQIIGVHATESRTAWSSFKDRFPWLLCNVGGGLLAAFLAGRYEDLLAQVVALALFLPVVLALSESVSIQSLTLTLQSLHGIAGGWRTFVRALAREFVTALCLGLACGGLVAAVAWLWQGSSTLGLVIVTAIGLSMILSCLLGFALPTLLHAIRRDPQIASGPIVLASADLVTLVIYLSLAMKALA